MTGDCHVRFGERLAGKFRWPTHLDLSIHWADLAREGDEQVAWDKSIQSRQQRKKFRKRQEVLLGQWSEDFVDRLNQRLADYSIEGLFAELDPDSNGEKVDVHFPRVTSGINDYQLDHVLLEFGGRNRGKPTVQHSIGCYIADVSEFGELICPRATVQAFDPAYILWEKLTALHQFSTMTREPVAYRLARHWYDVDCLLRHAIVDPLSSLEAMADVIEMKKQRWSEVGVDYESVLRGDIRLVPDAERLTSITKDHQAAVKGGMFYSPPDKFDVIIDRILVAQEQINQSLAAK